jgi:hypothetical protein
MWLVLLLLLLPELWLVLPPGLWLWLVLLPGMWLVLLQWLPKLLCAFDEIFIFVLYKSNICV